MENKIRVLHIDSEKTWRGGQQQAIYLHEGLTRRGISSLFVYNPGSALNNYCRTNSLPGITIRMRNEVDVIAAGKIANLCKVKDINIVQCHSAHSLSIGLLVKYLYSKIRLIGVRRVDFHIAKNKLSKIKYNSKRIDRIVCISEKIKSVMLEDGVDSDKLVTIRSGIDIHKFDSVTSSNSLRDELGINKDKIVVGTVAAFTGHKDYYNLVKAAEEVVNSNSEVVFIAVGDGNLFDSIKKLVEDKGLKNVFILPGYRKDIGSFLKMFDIFVLASKKEGLGTSILDAQAMGLPVVATRTGGIPEIVEHEKNGFLVEPKNSKMLAEAILELVNNEELRDRYGSRSMESVRKFDIDSTVNANIKLYKEILG